MEAIYDFIYLNIYSYIYIYIYIDIYISSSHLEYKKFQRVHNDTSAPSHSSATHRESRTLLRQPDMYMYV